jgi:glucuronate isomerase
MKRFLDENFLLQTETATCLYHEHAKKMPIIDYHCHLIPDQLAGNTCFDNLTQPWLYGDHYKWRAMRSNGVDEKYCSGNAGDWEKFEKWAETVPYTMRNPLYHWTHLELQRYFDIHELLCPETAGSIYEKASALLKQQEYAPLGLLKKMNVSVVCTTDDPIDTLEQHHKIRGNDEGVRVIPAWRPDMLLAIDQIDAFNGYVDRLAEVAGVEIRSFDSLIQALDKRHQYFHEAGCRLSDHGLEYFYAEDYTSSRIEDIFAKARSGKPLSREEVILFRSAMLYEHAVMDFKRGWTQQFHVGALRDNNTRMLLTYGPNGGFDSIGDFSLAIPMSRFLDRLDREGKLAKTILYNLNPADNEVMATMIGNFQDGSVPGKIQWGSAWWFLDQKDGIEKQLNTLSNLGLLSRFIGMLTDSRSLLSYPRHEYFRRILCNLVGNDVEKGELPNDRAWLGHMVENICYTNARDYFNF